MKRFSVCILAVILALAAVMNVRAQSTDMIWLSADTTSYKTGETVIIKLNAVSATPIQGFTFQIRYDPGCLRPVNASSPVTAMNGLSMPQIAGLVDGSYASTTPQAVNGVLAEVRFVTLGGCQTGLTLESAALAIRNAEGFASPLAGVTIGEKNIALNIDKEQGLSQPTDQASGSVLPLDPPPPAATADKGFLGWLIAFLAIILIGGAVYGGLRRSGKKSMSVQKLSVPTQAAALYVKHGSNAGKSFVLDSLPCLIGRNPENDICIDDPHIIGQHARIFAADNGYYLMDLGGETFINGHAVRRRSTVLKPGDVVRLGKSALFVFGT